MTPRLIEDDIPSVAVNREKEWKPDGKVIDAVIDLLDWIDRCKEDQRIGPERLLNGVVKKSIAIGDTISPQISAADKKSGFEKLLMDFETGKRKLQSVVTEFIEWAAKSSITTKEEADTFIHDAQDKSQAIASILDLERIERYGAYDVSDQQIMEMSDTGSKELDQTIEATVECGYRIGARLIRPQRVFVYRYVAVKGK